MRTNQAMRGILADVGELRHSGKLQPAMERLLAHGVNIKQGCIVLGAPENLPCLDAIRTNVVDETGYECFVNHEHFSAESDKTALADALTFCRRLTIQLRALTPDRDFRFIVSKGSDWTVRFHTVRAGEQWASENLESYTDEAILVLDSTDPLITESS